MTDDKTRDSRMRRSTLALELQDKGKRLSEVRRGSAFDLVAKGGEEITREQFEKLHDVIAAEMEAEMEAAATLAKKAAAVKRKLKLFICALASLMFVLTLSLLGNFFIIFFVVDGQVKTTTTSNGLLEAKNSDMIVKTAVATEDVPLVVAPVLDLDTLAGVKMLKATYNNGKDVVEAELSISGVRKYNTTFVEFITTVPGETVEILNGHVSLVRKELAKRPVRFGICSANATCSAFRASGIDTHAALYEAAAELKKHGFYQESADGQCVDAPDVLVAIHSEYTVRSCAEAGSRGLCGNPSIKEGCCLTCSSAEDSGTHGRSMQSKGLFCLPAGTSWYDWTYTPSTPHTTGSMSGNNKFEEAEVRMWDGFVTDPSATDYNGARHVVFILHGMGGDGPDMHASFSSSLDVFWFKGFMFVYPTSGNPTYWGNTQWACYNYGCSGVNSAYSNYLNYGMPQLQYALVDFVANTNSGTDPTGVTSCSLVFAIGYSDGGHMGIFANLYNNDAPHVHSAVGLAGHPHVDYTTDPAGGGIVGSGPTAVDPMESTGIRSHAYWTDNDYYYESSAMPDYAAFLSLGAEHAGLTSPSSDSVSTNLGGYDFTQQSWSADCAGNSHLGMCKTRVVFEVHDHNDTPNFGATGGLFNPTSHNNFGTDTGLWDDILFNSTLQFLVDTIHQDCGCTPGGLPCPPPPSPSPPPSPPPSGGKGWGTSKGPARPPELPKSDREMEKVVAKNMITERTNPSTDKVIHQRAKSNPTPPLSVQKSRAPGNDVHRKMDANRREKRDDQPKDAWKEQANVRREF